MTESELAEIERREQAATPGPWRHSGNYITPPYSPDYRYKITQLGGTKESPGLIARNDARLIPDVQFIAHAREDIPKLLAEVRRLQAEKLLDTKLVQTFAEEIDRLRAEVGRLKPRPPGNVLHD